MCFRCKILLAAAAAFLLLMTAVNSQDNIMTLPPTTPAGPSCQAFSASELPYCTYLNFSMVGFPNARDHMTQTEAFTEMNDFKRLIETSCSGAILSFLCGYYAPVCLQNQLVSTITLLPCRSLCMEVRSKCEYFVQCGDHGNPSWPAHLDCQNFPDEMPCFGPDDPSTITIPSDVPGITVTSITRVASSSCVFAEPVPTTIQPTSSMVQRMSTPAGSTMTPSTRPTSPVETDRATPAAASTIIIQSLTIIICAALAVAVLLLL